MTNLAVIQQLITTETWQQTVLGMCHNAILTRRLC